MDVTATHSVVSQPGYFFPVLKPNDIQKCMSELGFDLTKEELQEPAHHKEKLRKAFQFLLEVCAGKTEKDFVATQALLHKVVEQRLPYPELHQEWSELRFYTALRDMLENCGYNNFSWRDLYAPTKKRYQTQLSAILNLAKFREEQLELYGALTEPRTMMIAKLDEVNTEHDQLQEVLEEKQQRAKVHYHEMEEIMRECEELEVEIARNNKRQAATREESAALKKKANELQDAVSTAQWALEQAEAEEESLRSQVVSSPDRRKSEMYIRQERLRKIKEDCAALETTVQETKTKVVNALQTLQDLDATNTVLDDLQDEVNKHSELVRKLDETRKKYLASDKKTAELHKQMEEAERQLARAEAKIVQQRKQHQLQIDAVTDELNMAKQQLLRVEKDRREGMARVEAGEKEVQALQNAMEQARRTTEAEIETVLAEYKQVEADFLERNRQQVEAVLSQCATTATK